MSEYLHTSHTSNYESGHSTEMSDVDYDMWEDDEEEEKTHDIERTD